MKKSLTIFLLLFSINYSNSQVPYIVWQRAMGGNMDDAAYCIIKSLDNEIAIIGSTRSNVQSPDIPNQHATGLNSPDFWFLKLANDGSVLYSHCYGGGYDEDGYSITQTRNGKFLLFGDANSNDQDVQGLHGAGTQVGIRDFWLVQLDTMYNIEWQHCYGTTEEDNGLSIKPTRDDGFVLLGMIAGFDGDVTNFHGSFDLWAVKVDSVGNIQWQTALGGYMFDEPRSLMVTQDGGSLISGIRSTIGGNITCTDAQKEIWLVKLDSLGNIVWDRCYGGSGSEQIQSFLPTLNNGFYAAGLTSSVDGDVSFSHGMTDAWIFKAYSAGNIIWEKTFGGSDWDGFSSMTFAADNSIVLSGGSRSPEFNFQGGSSDVYVVKIDTAGNLIWENCYGGSGDDWSNSITEASDSSLFLVGYSTSNDGDLTLNRGLKDMWIVKLSSPTQTGINTVQNSVINLFAHLSEGLLSINFFANKVEDVKINLYDVSGRRVKTINHKTQIGENHLETFCNTIQGVYILQIEFKNGLLSKKLVY